MSDYDDYDFDAEGDETLGDLLGNQPVDASEYASADDRAQAELEKLRQQVAAIDARMQPPHTQSGEPYTGPTPADHEVSPDSLWGLSPVEANAKFSAKDIAETDELGNKRTPEARWAEAWNRVMGGQPPRSRGGA